MQKASSVSGEGRREGGKYLPTRILLPGKGFFLLKGEWMEHGPVPGVAQAGAAGPLPTSPLSQRHGAPGSPGTRSGGFLVPLGVSAPALSLPADGNLTCSAAP